MTLDLQKLLHAAAVCALSAGGPQSEEREVAMHHPQLIALAAAVVSHSELRGCQVT